MVARRPSSKRTRPSSGRNSRNSRTRRRTSPRTHAIRLVVVLGLAAIGALAIPGSASEHADAAAPATTVGPIRVGADVSWPTCKHPDKYPLPARPAFAIVGINDGEPGTRNGCLTAQLAWAQTATGGTTQPTAAVYVMAADPFSPYERKWTKPIWPRTAAVAGHTIAVPAAFGAACHGKKTSRACAYVFGWSIAIRDAKLEGLGDPTRFTYWIDVEMMRDWSADQTFNRAIVEGMAAGFLASPAQGGVGAAVGLYSTPIMWSDIVGTVPASSILNGLPNWIAIGPGSAAEAKAAMQTLSPLTVGSKVEIVQYVDTHVDLDYAPAAG